MEVTEFLDIPFPTLHWWRPSPAVHLVVYVVNCRPRCVQRSVVIKESSGLPSVLPASLSLWIGISVILVSLACPLLIIALMKIVSSFSRLWVIAWIVPDISAGCHYHIGDLHHFIPPDVLVGLVQDVTQIGV